MAKYRLLVGDCREMLRTLPDESVHCVVTSPPYWGLRDYGVPPTVWGGDPDCDHEWGQQERGRRKDVLPSEQSAAGRLGTHERATGLNDGGRVCVRCGAWRGQLGLEPTPELYVEHMVEVFREVRRVLRRDGTLWLNLGDSYAVGGMSNPSGKSTLGGGKDRGASNYQISRRTEGLKPKDLVGIPWRVAFALQADGWYLRSDIIWAKPNPMPESVTDRPTKAHEYIFLMSKSPRYYYDAEAVAEEAIHAGEVRKATGAGAKNASMGRYGQTRTGFVKRDIEIGYTRNARSVWAIPTKPYPGAHFATFPPELAERCILAGTSERGCCPECGAPWERVVERTPMKIARSDRREQLGEYGRTQASGTMLEPARAKTIGWRPGCECNAGDPVPCTVLDPFAGAGTTLLVASRRGRSGIGIELSPRYAEMATWRIEDDCPLFVAVETQTACDRTGTVG